MFEDGTEMEWVSKWVASYGVGYDGIIMCTENNANAGGWQGYPITNPMRYICEKN